MLGQLVVEPVVVIAVLIAATLPFAISILTSFTAATRVNGLNGYFLYDRDLDVDGFVKTSIGYSLQVASLALFFYWTMSKGALGPMIVCAAWGAGYYAMAWALGRKKFDNFLGTGRKSPTSGAETIHGFIGSRLTGKSAIGRRLAILAVSFASVLGLAGTMMIEISFSADYLLQGLGTPTTDLVRQFTIQFAILTFTALYVLWGGYRSAVTTDRFQVPVAYVFFSIFMLAVAVWAVNRPGPTGMGLVVLAFGAVVTLLLVRRIRLLNKVDPADTWNRLTAILTFGPILILTAVALIFLLRRDVWDVGALWSAIFPTQKIWLGFGVWGTIALVAVNFIWQFIDISSLQRLQSLDKTKIDEGNAKQAVSTLKVTGTEAALGWFLIILAAAVLKIAGFSADSFVSQMLADDLLRYVVPIFLLTVFVYMLSTISGLISAISFISYYDIVPSLTAQKAPDLDQGSRALLSARVTTVVALALLFILYLLLKLSAGQTIAAILYAIYAFQIAILPSVLAALFLKNWPLLPSAVMLSVVSGVASALFVALNPESWRYLAGLGVTGTDWETMPPLISTTISLVTFVLATYAAKFRPPPKPASTD